MCDSNFLAEQLAQKEPLTSLNCARVDGVFVLFPIGYGRCTTEAPPENVKVTAKTHHADAKYFWAFGRDDIDFDARGVTVCLVNMLVARLLRQVTDAALRPRSEA